MANAEQSQSLADREKLRKERKLSLIQQSDQGKHIDFIPPGSYGFTYSPSTDGVPLFMKHTFQVFEVHKLFNGAVHFIGYLSPAEAKILEEGKEMAELKLYPEPYESATAFVSVPADRVMRAKPTTRDGGNWMGFLCAPKES